MVVSNPTNAHKGKKTRVVCLSKESRTGPTDNIEGLQNLKSLEQRNSNLGITQVFDIASIRTFPVIDTRFGQCPVSSFGFHHLSFTE